MRMLPVSLMWDRWTQRVPRLPIRAQLRLRTEPEGRKIIAHGVSRAESWRENREPRMGRKHCLRIRREAGWHMLTPRSGATPTTRPVPTAGAVGTGGVVGVAPERGVS